MDIVTCLRLFIFTAFGFGFCYFLRSAFLVGLGYADSSAFDDGIERFFGKFLYKYVQRLLKNNKIKRLFVVILVLICSFTCVCVCSVTWDCNNSFVYDWLFKDGNKIMGFTGGFYL